jgi:biopolymer transport protein ExbD
MNRRRPRSQRLVAEINITPFTDVILVLLIIFMITTPLFLQSGIKVNLPKVTKSPMQMEKQLVLTVTKDGQYFLNDKRVYLATLAQELKAQFVAREDRLLVIKADRDVLHGTVVKVMDIAKQSGADKLAIATESEK